MIRLRLASVAMVIGIGIGLTGCSSDDGTELATPPTAIIVTTTADPDAVPAARPARATTTTVALAEYTVQPGDTFFGIIERFGADAELVLKVNRITDPATLNSGQRLLIPVPPTVATEATTVPGAVAPEPQTAESAVVPPQAVVEPEITVVAPAEAAANQPAAG